MKYKVLWKLFLLIMLILPAEAYARPSMSDVYGDESYGSAGYPLLGFLAGGFFWGLFIRAGWLAAKQSSFGFLYYIPTVLIAALLFSDNTDLQIFSSAALISAFAVHYLNKDN